MKKIYLIDVSSMFFRAFYAVRPLHSTEGVPVNAVYGFISMISKLLKEKKPEYIAFCYDRKEPSFRKDLDVNYKANRTEMPDDLQVQMPYIKQVASLFGIQDIEVPGFEADDLIGSLSVLAAKNNFESVIVSGDKDFCQLVNEKTIIYDTMKETITTPDLVFEKYGVKASQFVDYLAIVGDTSDNIKGVAGVGPKGAQKLIEEFGSLKNIYESIDKVSSKGVQEKLKKSEKEVFLAQKLVQISLDVPLEKNIEDFKKRPLLTEELRQFFRKLNFKSFEKTIIDEGQVDSSVVLNDEKIDLSEVGTKESLSISIVTTQSQIVEIIELTLEELSSRWSKEGCFVFSQNDYLCFGFNNQLVLKSPLELTDTTFFKNKKWSGYDLKSVWRKLNFTLETMTDIEYDFDLMVAAYSARAADTSHLEKIIKHYLKIEIDLKKTEISILYGYLLSIVELVKKEFSHDSVVNIYEKIDRPLIKILFEMEMRGFKIDVNQLKDYSIKLSNEISDLEKQIQNLAGENFNVASPKQLGVILFEKLDIASIKKTKTGYSTDNDVLEKIEHPIAGLIIQYRELAKLKSTYVDALPLLADQNQRVHGKLNQAMTATGRLSSTDPNLQNIPIKTEKGQVVRQCFITEPNMKLVSLDYSQIELRILAHISNDRGLIQAFADDLDIHQATASEVFSTPLSQVSKEQRRVAKAVNFGIAYGQGAFGLAETLGISRTESKEIIEKYFKKFSGIKEYIDSTIEQANQNKFVETLFGRRRYIDELKSSNMMIKKFGERAAINAPIQGTASDLVKLAMSDIERSKNKKINLLLQVHDELIFEGTEENIRSDLDQIKFKMENVVKLKVPLKVNFAIGDNWNQSH